MNIEAILAYWTKHTEIDASEIRFEVVKPVKLLHEQLNVSVTK